MLIRLFAILLLLMAAPAYATDVCSSDWSETDASNNQASPRGAPEGMAPSGVNDTMRAMMGATKRFWNRNGGVKTTAGTNTVTVSYDVAAAAYCTGERFLLKAGGTNTGAATLNVNSLGAKDIKLRDGDALAGGEIQSGQYFEVVYDGTNMVLLSAAVVRGTFTATLTVASGSVTQTVSAGFYERVGSLVYVWGTVTISASSAPSGSLKITNLPFTSQNTSNSDQAVTLSATPGSAQFLFAGAGLFYSGHIPPNTTYIELFAHTESGGAISTGGTSVVNATASLTFSGFYRTAG